MSLKLKTLIGLVAFKNEAEKLRTSYFVLTDFVQFDHLLNILGRIK